MSSLRNKVALITGSARGLGKALVESNGCDMEEIAKLLETGAVKFHIAGVYSFEQIGLAHLAVESGRTVGKVIVRL